MVVASSQIARGFFFFLLSSFIEAIGNCVTVTENSNWSIRVEG